MGGGVVGFVDVAGGVDILVEEAGREADFVDVTGTDDLVTVVNVEDKVDAFMEVDIRSLLVVFTRASYLLVLSDIALFVFWPKRGFLAFYDFIINFNLSLPILRIR